MTHDVLPRWDMTPFFASLEDERFAQEVAGYRDAVERLAERMATLDVRGGGALEADEALVDAFERVTQDLEDVLERGRLLGAFVSSYVTTDSRDEVAQERQSDLHGIGVAVEKLVTRFTAWIGRLDLDALIRRSSVAADRAFALRMAAVDAAHQMSEAEEDLASDLRLSGGTAWTKLHGNVSSRLRVGVDTPSGVRTMPMSAVRGLANDPDAAVREAAYRAEIEAWERTEVPLAAALNGVKGWQSTLRRRRGWDDDLAPSLKANNVDRTTLEAMQEAVTASFPDFRRYLRAKAKLLGRTTLRWWDLFAPVGEDRRRWSWDDATTFVVANFGTYSDRLASLASRAFAERWVDAEPREGKRDGAFCMGVRAGESRVLTNYTGSFGSVSTVAHELGHAYHNLNLAHRTPLQRRTPMALAETASIFCETIVTNAAMDEATGADRLALLEHDLVHACQIVVDIHSRFLFEREVFARRADREVSVTELKELMVAAQRETYGDALDPDALHPYMWAVKPHYYSSTFYNWPYTFGFLFGLGLYERYRADPDTFRAGYDDLLASTGLEDAATLTARFDVDVRDRAFWSGSLDVVRRRIDDLERQIV